MATTKVSKGRGLFPPIDWQIESVFPTYVGKKRESTDLKRLLSHGLIGSNKNNNSR